MPFRFAAIESRSGLTTATCNQAITEKHKAVNTRVPSIKLSHLNSAPIRTTIDFKGEAVIH